MPARANLTPFSLLVPPYREFLPIAENEDFPAHPRVFRGAALVWNLSAGARPQHLERAAGRPGGLPLMILLPPASRIVRFQARMLELVEEARPCGILPHHPEPGADELRCILRQGPLSFGGDTLDYLWWRGLRMDQDTRRLVARIAELSGELRTLAAVARSVYLSRRALGRRFRDRGLPPPSRWLQFFRILRASQLLQSTDRSLSSIAHALGYPEGFTLSNQMERMVGARPSVIRERLGWEWILETWLRFEWERGGLQHDLRGFPTEGPPDRDPDPHARASRQSDRAERTGEAA
jgi:AraC-like DNA-binding protein